MKKIIYIAQLCTLAFGLSACSDWFLDKEPQDERTDVVYFKTASQFKEYTAGFYGQLQGWGSPYGGYAAFMDVATDLSAYFGIHGDVGHGTILPSTTDVRWDNCYKQIRTVNLLFERARNYPGDQEEIKQYLAEAHFFRAYNYFFLLQFFGGVPIVETPLDVNSPELYGVRNSRYEVVDFILKDLDDAIAGLPKETLISIADKGRISYHGAEAFKARVLLYEATWRKYVGTTTDFKGSAGPASDQVNDFFDEAVRLCREVIDDNLYSIWNYNHLSGMKDMSYRYLFCLEDATTNPAGMTKESNKEFIIKSVYDKDIKPGGVNLNETVRKMDASRKLMDLFLCTDGLPVEISKEFEGYATPEAEFQNRDNRMKSDIDIDAQTSAAKELKSGTSGYGNMKFMCPARVTARTESPDYPVLRLAEVYLIFAEAVCERNNGVITDEELNYSINKLRGRAGIANLTNALVDKIKSETGTNKSREEVMLDEIRRERAVELYMEGFRFDDLKRWGIAENELNESRMGTVVGNASYPTTFVDASGNTTSKYARNTYVWGEEQIDTQWGKLNCVVVDSKENFTFSRNHYLWPLPQQQINLNPNLVQNPGY